ncbi:MAG: sigma-70 family RNA polymerase sigma factor [Acidimicrobiia bacterium]|nr:sigma-70 family RNA polymerase sigma factor [Acidimicrobiia bacterium]
MRPEDIVVRREQDRLIVEAITRLRPMDQQVLRLAAWEGLPASGIAKVIGCSPAAAEQRLHRAKKRLAKVVSPSFASVPFPTSQVEVGEQS